MSMQDYNEHNGICPNSKNVTGILPAQEWSLWKPGHEAVGRLPGRLMSLTSNVTCLGGSLVNDNWTFSQHSTAGPIHSGPMPLWNSHVVPVLQTRSRPNTFRHCPRSHRNERHR